VETHIQGRIKWSIHERLVRELVHHAWREAHVGLHSVTHHSRTKILHVCISSIDGLDLVQAIGLRRFISIASGRLVGFIAICSAVSRSCSSIV
jgi:hypothetical protein